MVQRFGGRVQFGIVAIEGCGCGAIRGQTARYGPACDLKVSVATLAVRLGFGDSRLRLFESSTSGTYTRRTESPESPTDPVAVFGDHDSTGFDRTVESVAPVAIDRVDIGEQSAEHSRSSVSLWRDSVDDRIRGW